MLVNNVGIVLRAETAIVVCWRAFREQVVSKLAEAHARERIPVAHQGSQQHNAQHLCNRVFLEAAALSKVLKLDVEIGQKRTKEALTKCRVSNAMHLAWHTTTDLQRMHRTGSTAPFQISDTPCHMKLGIARFFQYQRDL